MKVSFRKLPGDPSQGILFFWMLSMDASPPNLVVDQFIPELFFDFLFIRAGRVLCVDKITGDEFSLPPQSLKTLFTRPLMFRFSTPLMLFGARFALDFAGSFLVEMKANSFLEQAWVRKDTKRLENFKSQMEGRFRSQQEGKFPHPLFSSGLDESSWMANFSSRHKRRIYQSVFGLSRKDLRNIANLHVFLEQACDFTADNPRIIQHVNPDVFYDQPHLNHSFKKMTGVSPVEYFQASSILQDRLMAASYNEIPGS